MTMKNKCDVIGFLGIEKYDIIIYLSMILVGRGSKVLLIDSSKEESLKYCISIPEALNPKVDIINYRGLDFIMGRSYREFEEEYDYILIDYGFERKTKEIIDMDKLVFVTDKQLHNVKRLTKVLNTEATLVVRDTKEKKIIAEIAEIFVHSNISIKKLYSLGFDEVDKSIMFNLQYNNKICIKKLSYSTKNFLEIFSRDILNIEEKEYIKAYRKVRGGV